MPAPDRLERLTDLVLVLLNTKSPLTLAELARDVPGYPEGHDARRQALERDKRLLRDEGIPILTESVEGPDQFGYRIDADAFYLPDLQLTPDEQASLQLAVAGVHLGDPSGRDALAKLGASGVGDARPLASFDPPRALVPLFDAVRLRAVTDFSYRGLDRSVTPAGLWFRNGHWYVVGWDADRGAGRTFRVDRIEGAVTVGPPSSGRLPEDFDAQGSVPDEPWRVGGEEVEQVELLVDAVEAARVTTELGDDAVTERSADGSVRFALAVSNRDALRSWVLGMLDHAQVLAPPDLRGEIVGWLERIVDANPAGDARPSAPSETRASESPTADADGRVVPRTRDVRDRLRRLLAIVGWLAKVGVAPIEEVATRFEVGEEELIAELELAACCGVPPYSPDALMEIIVTEGTVEAFLPEALGRPRRLTPAEGFALSAAARTILAVPGADAEGSLARALAKLEAALGARQGLTMDLPSPPHLGELQQLVEEGRSAEIEYHSGSTDEVTQRRIDPLRVISLDGRWYVDAYCHRAEGMRRFRVDRIRSIVALGEQSEVHPPAAPASSEAFVPGPSAAVVQLRLGPRAAWVLDSVPVLASSSANDALNVTLAVGGTAWFERLALQAGPDLSVVDPPEWSAVIGTAAARVLSVYR
jgi:proteasome accessory factor BC